jgi:hypothetical protein
MRGIVWKKVLTKPFVDAETKYPWGTKIDTVGLIIAILSEGLTIALALIGAAGNGNNIQVNGASYSRM